MTRVGVIGGIALGRLLRLTGRRIVGIGMIAIAIMTVTVTVTTEIGGVIVLADMRIVTAGPVTITVLLRVRIHDRRLLVQARSTPIDGARTTGPTQTVAKGHTATMTGEITGMDRGTLTPETAVHPTTAMPTEARDPGLSTTQKPKSKKKSANASLQR